MKNLLRSVSVLLSCCIISGMTVCSASDLSGELTADAAETDVQICEPAETEELLTEESQTEEEPSEVSEAEEAGETGAEDSEAALCGEELPVQIPEEIPEDLIYGFIGTENAGTVGNNGFGIVAGAVDDIRSGEIRKGDINSDGVIDLSDLTLFSEWLLGDVEISYEQKIAADVDCDRYSQADPDVADFASLRQIVLRDYEVLVRLNIREVYVR